MYDVGQINILLETSNIILSLVVLVFLLTGGDRDTRLNRLFMRIVICNIAAMACDIFAWGFNGGVSAHAIVIARAAKFATYVLQFLLIPLLADYVIKLISKKAKIGKGIGRVMYLLFFAAFITVVVSQYNGMYYYFDEDNRYQVGEMFWLSQAIGSLFLLLITAFVLRHRKSAGMSDTLFLMSYPFFPILAMGVHIFTFYEIEFIFVASTISIVASYGGIQARQAKLLRDREFDMMQTMINSAPLCCQLWDDKFNIIDCNDENIRFFRVKNKEEFFANHGLGFVPEKQPCGRTSHEMALEQTARVLAGERMTFEWVQLIEGEHIPVEVTLDSVKLGNEKFITAYVRDMRDHKRVLELEKELAERKIAVMLSQIQPHFLYNALSAIQDLCVEDPETAQQMVVEFSHYLRGTLDSLSLSKPIPFERELKHVKTYLGIEKKRFEENLNVVYDIRTREFMLPALSLQLIAENAVRHGMNRRAGGVTVTIAASETDEAYVVTVTDNGAGFDQNAANGKRAGLKNVRDRLEVMCGGTLTVKSLAGEGTTAVISVPKN